MIRVYVCLSLNRDCETGKGSVSRNTWYMWNSSQGEETCRRNVRSVFPNAQPWDMPPPHNWVTDCMGN